MLHYHYSLRVLCQKRKTSRLRFHFYCRQNVRMPIQLIVIRIGVCACDIFYCIHRITIEIHIVFLVLIWPSFDSYDKLTSIIIGYTHISFSFKNDIVCPRIINGDFAFTFKLTLPMPKGRGFLVAAERYRLTSSFLIGRTPS